MSCVLSSVQDLLEAALQRPETERRAFLESACVDRPELLREALSLLDLLPRATTFFRDLERELVAGKLAELSAAALRRSRIGAYRTVERLGQGGMGEVYLAERVDGQFDRRVAIKLIRRGFDTGEAERRFLAERQLLAGLDHPGIARLIDGGVTDDGLPYFVMEHVEGLPIDEYCDRHGLHLKDRLRLFITLGEAVQYLHRNLVVHRDLKPANILVTADGTLKLLDFGIAKLLESGSTADAPATAADARILTPDYAAPEQILGESVTTATDVFALGVILYELLTGRRPFRRGRTLQEMEQAILTDALPPPSEVIGRSVPGRGEAERVDSPAQPATDPRETARAGQDIARDRGTTISGLRRMLRGDLDVLCLAALRKDAETRYRSAEQMVEDVRRHLAGQPIAARPPTRRYRAGKFLRRNRVGVTAAATVAALVIGFAALSVVQSARAARERDRAERVAELLVELFAGADPLERQGQAFTPRTFLDGVTARMDRDLGNEPGLHADLLAAAGGIYRNLGFDARAAESIERALALRTDPSGRRSAEAAPLLLELGELRRLAGDFQDAELLIQEAIEIFEHPESRDPTGEAASLSALALIRLEQGDTETAEHLLNQAFAEHERTASGDAAALAGVMENLAAVHTRRGEFARAESTLREAIALRRQRLGDTDPTVGRGLERLGALLEEKGDYDAATIAWEEAVALFRQALGRDHGRVAEALERLADVHMARGDTHAAEASLREALAIRRDRAGGSQLDFARGIESLATVLQRAGRAAEAEAAFREANIIRRRNGVTDDAWDVASGTVVTASSELRTGAAESMLDGNAARAVYFADYQPTGTIHFVEWETPAPRSIARFSLHAAHDSHGEAGPTPGCFRLPSPYQHHRDANHRGIDRFTLRAWNPATLAFDHVLYDGEIPLRSDDHIHPGEHARLYDAPSIWTGQSYLLLESAVPVVTTHRWRAEFRQLGCPSAESGPRVIQLDGFEG